MEIENEFDGPGAHRPRLGLPAGRRARGAVHARRRAHRGRRRPHLEGQGQHEARAGLARRSPGRSRCRSATTRPSAIVLAAKGMEQKGKGAANASVTSWLETGRRRDEREDAGRHPSDRDRRAAEPRPAPRGQPQAHAAVRRLPPPEHAGGRGAGDRVRRRRRRGERPPSNRPRGPSRSEGSASGSPRSGRRSRASSGVCSASARRDLRARPGGRRGHAVRRHQAARDPPRQAARAARGRRGVGGGRRRDRRRPRPRRAPGARRAGPARRSAVRRERALRGRSVDLARRRTPSARSRERGRDRPARGSAGDRCAPRPVAGDRVRCGRARDPADPVPGRARARRSSRARSGTRRCG